MFLQVYIRNIRIWDYSLSQPHEKITEFVLNNCKSLMLHVKQQRFELIIGVKHNLYRLGRHPPMFLSA